MKIEVEIIEPMLGTLSGQEAHGKRAARQGITRNCSGKAKRGMVCSGNGKQGNAFDLE